MASTYTQNNKFEKPGVGEQAGGTWGSTSNTNFDLIDSSVDGFVAVALTGTTHTLNIPDATAADGRNKVISFTGTLAAANTVTVTPNTVEKLYFLQNNTTGGQNVIIAQGSGSTVTIKPGYSSIVYLDGAGAGAGAKEVLTSLKLANLLEAAGVLVNIGTARTFLGGTTTPLVQVEGTSQNASISIVRNSDNNAPTRIITGKTRGTTAGSFTAVQNADAVAELAFLGADGTSFVNVGAVGCYVDGAVSTGIIPGRIVFFTANTTGQIPERASIDSSTNYKLGGTADRSTTAGTNQIVIFNGTAPVGTLANGASFYVTSGEMRVMDAAGNATLLSPHDRTTNEWIYDSTHTPTGKRLKISVEKLLRFVNDHFGLDCVMEEK